jgi:dTDP-4-dehydrorhamnose reductase
MPPFRVLVTGASGFLGPWVLAELRRRGCSVLTASRRVADLRLDLADPDAIGDVVAAQPAAVLHLAAMSRLADCAADPAAARAINADAAGALAVAFGARLLLVSTDLVFDGRKAPYGPLAAVEPLSEYGASKAAGEELALQHGGRVARLPLLFAADARRGATGMIRGALRDRQLLGLFTNEYRTPLHCADAAVGLCDQLFAFDGPPRVHLPGPERLSRWELGQRFCAVHGLRTELLAPVECQDSSRPIDVSLASEWRPGRDLDAMLRDA